MIDEEFESSVGKWAMRACVAMFIIACVTGGCSYLNKKAGISDENIIEERVESALEKYLGIPEDSLDLTPKSPE